MWVKGFESLGEGKNGITGRQRASFLYKIKSLEYSVKPSGSFSQRL